jgi:hypothetical protein
MIAYFIFLRSEVKFLVQRQAVLTGFRGFHSSSGEVAVLTGFLGFHSPSGEVLE